MPPKGKGTPRKAANGYKLPDPLPPGEVIRAPHAKKEWRLGKSIGERKKKELFGVSCLSFHAGDEVKKLVEFQVRGRGGGDHAELPDGIEHNV